MKTSTSLTNPHLFSLLLTIISAVFSLPEGKMLSFFKIVPEGHPMDIPNGVLGMLFYTYTILRYMMMDNKKKQPFLLFTFTINLIISTLAIASSLFLARKLYMIRELCVVCVTTHIINTTLWIRAARGSKKTVKIK